MLFRSSTSDSSAAARDVSVGKRRMNSSKRPNTVATRVCCSITSESHVAYGSDIPRHGRVRACSRYQGMRRFLKATAFNSAGGAAPPYGSSPDGLSEEARGKVTLLAIFMLPISWLSFHKPIHCLGYSLGTRFVALGIGNPLDVLATETGREIPEVLACDLVFLERFL